MMELLEALIVQLAQDKSWQSNLTEAERQAALCWATEHLRTAMQSTYTETRARLRTLNVMMGSSPNFVGRGTALRAWLE